MRGRSTTSNLVQFVHTANLTSIDSKQLDVIYSDFNKAFDHIDHSYQIKKLRIFGFELFKIAEKFEV